MTIIINQEQQLKELYEYKNWLVLVSGGWESTLMALELNDYRTEEINFVLLNNDTGLRLKKSVETLEKLKEVVKPDEYIEIKASEYLKESKRVKEKKVKEVLDYSFRQIDRQIERMNKGLKYDRNYFRCCSLLKKNPFHWWIRKNREKYKPEESIIVSGIAPYESRQRAYRLVELRKKGTFKRFYKTVGYWFFYPYRDFYKRKEVYEELVKRGFKGIEHSGCIVCPIMLIFEDFKKKEPEAYARSKRYLNNLLGLKNCQEEVEGE